MYIGQYIHSIDSKNRLFIPAKFRSNGKLFILTKGLERCLCLYDHKSWSKVLEKLDNLSIPNKLEERAFKRALLSGAHEVEPDTQGRILIPSILKNYARINSMAIIIGVGNRLEIWDQNEWEKYYHEQANVSFKKLASKLEI